MASSYEILIAIQAKADEVVKATAAITSLVAQATSTGPALASGISQGTQATQALAGGAQAAGASLTAAGQQGQAAGGAVASSMTQAGAATKEAANEASEASRAWSGLEARLQDGITFGFGTEVVEKGIELLMEIPKLFVEAGQAGIEYDKEIETSSIGLAATLRSVSPEKYLNFATARSAAEAAMETLQAKANELGISFKSLAESYSANLRALIEGGVTEPAKQIELISTLIQAGTSKGINGMQALRDSIDILNGRAGNITLAKELGLESAALKEAAANGQLYELIMSKIGGYREAAVASAASFAGLQQTVSNLIQQLEGTATLPVFVELKKDLADIKTLLDSVSAKGFASTLAIELGGSVDAAKELYGWLEKIALFIQHFNPLSATLDFASSAASLLSGTPGATGQYVAQLDANTKLVATLQQQASAATTVEDIEQARKTVADAITKTYLQAVNATGDQKTAAQTLLISLGAIENSIGHTSKSTQDVTAGTHEAAGAAGELTKELEASNKELGKMLDKLPDIVQKYRAAATSRKADALPNNDKIDFLNQERPQILAQINEGAQQFGIGNVQDQASAVNALDIVNRTSGNGQAMLPGEPEALQKMLDGTQQLVQLDKDVAAAQKDQTAEAQKQAAASAANLSDDNYRLEHARAIAAGNKDGADQLERQRDIAKEATDISKARKISYADALPIATQLVDQEAKAADAIKAGRDAKKEQTQAARDAAQVAAADYKEQQLALTKINDLIAETKKNTSLTDSQKQLIEKALLDEERVALLKDIDLWEKRIAVLQKQGDPGSLKGIELYRTGIEKATKSLNDLNQAEKLMTFGGDLTAQLNKMQNQWGSVTHSIATTITSTIGTALDGISNAITGLITGTTTWRQAFVSTADSIISSIIKITVQQVVGRTIVAAINKAFGLQDQQQSAAQASAAAASWTPAAVAASTASYGAAAGAGLAAFLGALGAGEAASVGLASSGFAYGGLIPGSPSSTDNRMARVATGEYVVRAAAVSHYGAEIFENLNRMQVPSARSAYASGGLVGGNYSPLISSSQPAAAAGGQASGGSKVVFVEDRRQAHREMLKDPDVKTQIIDLVRGARAQIGVA